MDLSYVSMLLNWTVYVCSIILCNSFTIYLTDLFDVSILCFLLSFVAIICQTKTSWCNSFTMPIFQVERQAVRGTSRKSRRAMAMIGSFPSMSSILSGSDALTGWGGLRIRRQWGWREGRAKKVEVEFWFMYLFWILFILTKIKLVWTIF